MIDDLDTYNHCETQGDSVDCDFSKQVFEQGERIYVRFLYEKAADGPSAETLKVNVPQRGTDQPNPINANRPSGTVSTWFTARPAGPLTIQIQDGGGNPIGAVAVSVR